MHRRLDTLIYIVSAVFLIGAATLWWQGVRPGGPGADPGSIQPVALPPENPDPSGSEDPAAPLILVVHVGGAVKSPGVYQMQDGQRVYEAVMLAEPEEDANLDLLNLAALLKDSQKIIVPRKGEPEGSGMGSGAGTASGYIPGTDVGYAGGGQPSFPININTATQAELEALPGIGPSLASAIVEYRSRFGPFARIEDLQKVSGIGEKTFAKLAPLIAVE
ncbi:MAG: ComEA family DNA-binding protein [Bacillota bacterium]|jgi:competence protein ComEA